MIALVHPYGLKLNKEPIVPEKTEVSRPVRLKPNDNMLQVFVTDKYSDIIINIRVIKEIEQDKV